MRLEAVIGGGAVAVYDAHGLLPRHPSKTYRERPLQQIRRVYVHHSGSKGKPGLAGLIRSARYVVRDRGWPGCPYHIWIPYDDLFDEGGRRVVYRAQPSTARTYHAGGPPNDRGVAVALQGNLTTADMSQQHDIALPAVVQWLSAELGITGIPLGHFEAHDGHAKASCPGRSGKHWVKGYRAGREPAKGRLV